MPEAEIDHEDHDPQDHPCTLSLLAAGPIACVASADDVATDDGADVAVEAEEISLSPELFRRDAGVAPGG